MRYYFLPMKLTRIKSLTQISQEDMGKMVLSYLQAEGPKVL